MSAPSVPSPPWDQPRAPPIVERKSEDRKASVVLTIMFFIVGLSVVLSYDWGGNPPAFRPDAATTILFGVLVAAIVYIAFRSSSTSRGVCPACRRIIPGDAYLCPYCGQRLR